MPYLQWWFSWRRWVIASHAYVWTELLILALSSLPDNLISVVKRSTPEGKGFPYQIIGWIINSLLYDSLWTWHWCHCHCSDIDLCWLNRSSRLSKMHLMPSFSLALTHQGSVTHIWVCELGHETMACAVCLFIFLSIQALDCRLFDAKPLSEPMSFCRHWDPRKTISIKYELKYFFYENSTVEYIFSIMTIILSPILWHWFLGYRWSNWCRQIVAMLWSLSHFYVTSLSDWCNMQFY